MIVYVVGEFPSTTEYFIRNEIVCLRREGLNIKVLSLKRGRGMEDVADGIFPVYARSFIWTIGAHVYILLKEKRRYFNAFLKMPSSSHGSLYTFLKSIKTFSIGVDFLFRLRKSELRHIHAHFISLPAEVAMVMSGISGISFSASAHARDIYTCDPRMLGVILRSASFVITCTAANKKYLERAVLPKRGNNILHVYHGIDPTAWPFRRESGEPGGRRIRLLSIGRLVEKKGLIYLLQAVSLLKRGNHSIHCNIVGDGPLKGAFQDYIEREDLSDVITLCGEQSQERIKGMYAASDLFILPCIVAPDGDRDGLPNVLVEALSMGLPVIATPVSAIPELIVHGSTGLLVPEKDPEGIVKSVLQLVNDKQLYESIARNGVRKITSEFNIDRSTSRLMDIFNLYAG